MFTGNAPAPAFTTTVDDLFHSIPTGLMTVDARGRIRDVNIHAAKLLRATVTDLRGRDASSLGWAGSRRGRRFDPWHLAFEQVGPTGEQWLRYQTPDGGLRSIAVVASVAVWTASRAEGLAVVTLRDVTDWERRGDDQSRQVVRLQHERRRITDRHNHWRRLASTDALTGCLNRRTLFGRVDAIWKARTRIDLPVAVAMIDIDHFKRLNDVHGHAVGDEALKAVAGCLNESFEGDDFVARYGGEEFCVVMPGRTAGEAAAMIERVRVAVERLAISREVPDLRTSISVGVSDTRGPSATPLEMINAADRALYAAKEHGRNRVMTHDTLVATP